jgi:hypothetical protein
MRRNFIRHHRLLNISTGSHIPYESLVELRVAYTRMPLVSRISELISEQGSQVIKGASKSC